MEINRIKEVLKKKGKSQAWLGRQLGISRNAINELCQNKSQPSLKRLNEIAKILEVPLSDLLTPNDFKSIFSPTPQNQDLDKNNLVSKINVLESKIDNQSKIIEKLHKYLFKEYHGKNLISG